MIVWLGVNLHEFYKFLFCSSQYIGIGLGRAGCSGQIEATWEANGCLDLENFPSPLEFALVRCDIVDLPLQVACMCL